MKKIKWLCGLLTACCLCLGFGIVAATSVGNEKVAVTAEAAANGVTVGDVSQSSSGTRYTIEKTENGTDISWEEKEVGTENWETIRIPVSNCSENYPWFRLTFTPEKDMVLGVYIKDGDSLKGYTQYAGGLTHIIDIDLTGKLAAGSITFALYIDAQSDHAVATGGNKMTINAIEFFDVLPMTIKDISPATGMTYSKNADGYQTLTYSNTIGWSTTDIDVSGYDITEGKTELVMLVNATADFYMAVEVGGKYDAHNLYAGGKDILIRIDLAGADYDVANLTENFTIKMYIDATAEVAEEKSITFKSIDFSIPSIKLTSSASRFTIEETVGGTEISWQAKESSDWHTVQFTVNNWTAKQRYIQFAFTAQESMYVGFYIKDTGSYTSEKSLISHTQYAKGENLIKYDLSQLSPALTEGTLTFVLYLDAERASAANKMTVTSIEFIEEEKCEVYSARLSLSDDIVVDYAVTLVEGYTDPVAYFTYNGKETVVDTYTVESGMYVFSFAEVTPQYMWANIDLVVKATYNGEQVVVCEKLGYSVRAYCESVLSKTAADMKLTEAQFAKLQTLAVDLLNYGAEAQVYTNVATDDLANKNLTDEQKALATDYADPANKFALTQTGDEEVVLTGARLFLDSKVFLGFGFDRKAQAIADLTVKISVGGTTYTFTADDFVLVEGTTYEVRFSEISAAQFDETITVQVFNGETAVSAELSYSVNSYIARNVNALTKVLYSYGAAAKSYLSAEE